MKTPLEALTEVMKRIQDRREVYREKVRECRDAGRHGDSAAFITQAMSMTEALDIISDVKQGH